MSYILDALRRAEADRERERGAVPGLHSPTLPGETTSPARAARGWLPWAGAGFLLLAGMAGGWWWADSSREPAAALAPVPPAATVTPAPTAPVVTATPALAQASAPVIAATPVAPSPASATSPYLPPVPPPVAAPAPAPAPTPAPAAARAATSTPEAQVRLPLIAELPEATRRALPRLAFGGSVYSDDPGSRLVIVNGEVQREGATLGNDLVLEQIRPRELVLRFQGQRYRQPL